MITKLIMSVWLSVMVICCTACSNETIDDPPAMDPTPIPIPFPIYSEYIASDPSFVPSIWMGNVQGISLVKDWGGNPQEGDFCIHVIYKSPSDATAQTDVCWLPHRLDTSEEWGTQVDGVNLSGASRLTFWARGASGDESVRFFVGGEGPKGDSLSKRVLTTTLTTEWRQYSINLNGADLTNVIRAFCWETTGEVEFWVDDVKFE